jgi:RING-like zinc finger
VIEAIPTLTVGGSGGGLTPDDDPRCCICLADYAPGATLRKLPCSHQFHRCVVQGPVCRAATLQPLVMLPACRLLEAARRSPGAALELSCMLLLHVLMDVFVACRACLDTWLAQKATCPICQAAAAAGGGK